MVVIRKRNGDLTYIQPYQIVRTLNGTPPPVEPGNNPVQSFRLKDGSTVYGRVVRQTPVAVVVRQQNGSQTFIDPTDILSTSTVTDRTNAPNGNPVVGEVATPYLLNGRTAFTPVAGQVYYRNTYLIRNELEIGLTNGWSVGVVVNPFINNLYKTSELLNEAIYTNADIGTQLYTRVGIPIGSKVRLGAVFAAHLRSPFYQSGITASFQGTVLATLGDQQANVTLGYSFRIHSDSFFSYLNTEEALTIGAMVSLSPSLSFISDNSLKVKSAYSGPISRLSAALRIKSRQHAFDVGLLSAVNQTYAYSLGYGYRDIKFNVYPYLGYNVRFGGR